jgi:hypothetical protein
VRNPDPQASIDAADIFDWEYLAEIGEKLDLSEVRTLGDAVRLFAFDFTSASKTEHQNAILADWLRRATHLQSAETAEEVLKCLALSTKGELKLLRRFARENGVRIRRG